MLGPQLAAEPVRVHHLEGVTFGFLTLQNSEGHVIADGYILVFQDIRGRNRSEGTFIMNRPPHQSPPDESTDTWDTIEWLVKNVPDNNGRAGLLGVSYPGWLVDQSMDAQVQAYINTNALPLFVDETMGTNELRLRFNDPLKDSRTPDIIVRPNYGTIYTTSTSKNAEHGGFGYSDTGVGLLVSNPSLGAKMIKTPVATSQVAPTVLRYLNMDPQSLNSVRAEKTQVLPGLGMDVQ